MDKDTLRNLLISACVFLVLMWLWPRVFPMPQPPGPTPPGAADAVPPGTDRTATTSAPGAEPGEGAPAREAAPDQTGFYVMEAPEAQTVWLGAGPVNGMDPKAAPSPYRIRLGVSSVGASVGVAKLTDHAQTLNSPERYTLLSPAKRNGSVFRSLAIERINIDQDFNVELADKRWHMSEVEPVSDSQTGDTAGQRLRCWVEIGRGDEPVLRLTRTLLLPAQSRKSGLHDLRSTLTIQNLTDAPHSVVVTSRGGLGIPQADVRTDQRHVDWGVLEGGRVTGERRSLSEIAQALGEPVRLFQPSPDAPGRRLSWAGTGNTYFTCTLAPVQADWTTPAAHIAELSGIDLDGDAATVDDTTIRFVTTGQHIPAGAEAIHYWDIYIGEKDAVAFRSVDRYAGRNYYFQIEQGFGWCTFSWLVELMIWLLNHIVMVTRDYGIAILVLVLVVRALLHPITKKGQVNMVRMQQRMGELQPKMEELKRKFANDKARLQQETMKLYRDEGVNPAGQLFTCLPMFIQLPIWIALYISLSQNILMRHEAAFWGLTWIDDMTAPDALYTFASPMTIPLLGWQIESFNLLPLLVALFMYMQQKLQPKPKPNPNMSDQQRQQQEMMQKMMPLMSIMMLIIFYPAPSGLNLYIMFSSLFGTIEQHYIRRHIREQEEAGALHQPKKKPDQPHRKRRSEMSFFEKLQKMAEDAQKSQPKKPRDKARR